jgi:5-formyltetrahydrofolate cyclo-ligase
MDYEDVMLKAALRDEYLNRRLKLSEEERANLDRALAENLFDQIEFSSLHAISIFLPFEKFNEPDTWPVIYRLWKEFPQLEVFAPRVEFGDDTLSNARLTPTTALEPNRWGIDEPVGTSVPINSLLDLVIVPLVCADKNGGRVGYGKGYYDRFLSSCRTDCQKVGLGYFPPVETIEDLTELDVRLDMLVTP